MVYHFKRTMYISIGLLLLFSTRTLCISLKDGAYEDVNIVIDAAVKENDILIQRIKEAFTNASKLLFSASKYHVFFRKINIIIPKSWSQKRDYKPVPASILEGGYIITAESAKNGPHVQGLEKCGGHGTFMFLPTSTFLLKDGFTPWGYHANTIVHEWGHLRWGVFDEYAYLERGQPHFYLSPSGWKPVTCTEHVKGSVGLNGNVNNKNVNTYCDTRDTSKIMDKRCIFIPDLGQIVNASLMGHSYLPSLKMFCDYGTNVHESQRHDRLAPNNQNEFCDRQSAWEVMRKHPDFSKNQVHQPVSTETTPEFELLHATENYRVFVLDVSGSMAGEKIEILHQTCKLVIETLLPLESWLGIVTFNNAALTVKSLMEIVSTADRDELSRALPLYASGGTCIGCGITEGIRLLSSKLGNPEKSELIVVSDGETDDQDKNDAIRAALAAKVIVNTVGITQNADMVLRDIAQKTGGVHQSYLEAGSISFAEAFIETISNSATSSSAHFASLVSEKMDLVTQNVVTFAFALDGDLGRDTMVTVLTRTVKDLFIDLRGPSNYHQTLNVTGTSATMKLPGVAMAGDYNVTITGDFVGETLEYYAKSFPNKNDPITVSTKFSTRNIKFSLNDLSILYVAVSKGLSPVINASVFANVEASFKNCSLELRDNGKDPDVFKNDGTYSGYIFPQCLSPERVNVKVYVSGEKGTTFVGVTNSAPSFQASPPLEVIMDSFQRVKITEDLYVSNYTDPGETDRTDPGRISDVDVSYIAKKTTSNGESRNFTVTWTATGDDKNIGRATAYQFKISDNIDSLLQNFENARTLDLINETIHPKQSGENEAITIMIDAEASYTEPAFFAMRAVDDAGNTGPVSNIISVVVAKGYRANGVIANNPDMENVEPGESNNNNKLTYIIGGSVAGGLVLIMLVLAILLCMRKGQDPMKIV